MKKKILFVDDEEDIRTVVKILLTQAGYDVTVSEDADFIEGIETEKQPDLYLLDRRLVKTDALKICYMLKSHPRTKHIPVIMLSADPKVKDLYKDAGADAFVSKPFDINHLLQVISSHLANVHR